MASRDREPFASLLLYYLFKWTVVNPTFRVYFRGRVEGAQHVPKQGPLVVVANGITVLSP